MHPSIHIYIYAEGKCKWVLHYLRGMLVLKELKQEQTKNEFQPLILEQEYRKINKSKIIYGTTKKKNGQLEKKSQMFSGFTPEIPRQQISSMRRQSKLNELDDNSP